MRIFISGNEDVCRWHLPVAQAKAMSFVERCEKAGLTQNTFHFRFEETGATMQAQYAFGQLSLQMHAPFIPVEEEIREIEEEIIPEPGTFYIETAQGYFWVRVRENEEGERVVLLEKFEAMADPGNPFSQEFVYPAMGHRTPGMLSGSFGTEDSRYVLSQAGGVFVGKGQDKGTVKLPPTGAGWARINVEENTQVIGRFCIIENERGQSCFFKYLKVEVDDQDEILIELKHGNVNMLVEGESGGILPANLLKTPCWIHRKCTGSYLSPNKTIGYHTDIGSDDDYFGNADQAAPGIFAISSSIQDKLDNGGENVGSYFNHTQALYRIASFAAAPLDLSDSSITLILVSPTMIWDAESMDDLGWGGYGNTTFGCLDQRVDFTRNILAPRFCAVTYDFKTGEKVVVDIAGTLDSGGNDITIKLNTWDSFGFADFNIWSDIKCGPKYYYEQWGTAEVGEACGWTDEGTGYCMSGKIPVEMEIPKEQRYFQHAAVSFEENLTVKRHAEFCFGGQSYLSSPEYRNSSFYFLFNGLWYETFAAMWLTNPSVSNQCGLCAYPPWSQTPGGNVTFMVNGSVPHGLTSQWLAENATEYVINMQIVEPLAVRPIQLPMNNNPVDMLSFIAKVPEHLAAPNPPEVLVGGIKYPSPDVEGEIVECEYTLMSAPCECSPMQWGPYSQDIILKSVAAMNFTGGCPPYSWAGSGVSFVNYDGTPIPFQERKTRTDLYVRSNNECIGSMKVSDVCGNSLSRSKSISGTSGTVTGPSSLQSGTTGTFYHSLDAGAAYTGTLEMVQQASNGAVLRMPAGASGSYTASWDASCGRTANMSVSAVQYENSKCAMPYCGCGPMTVGTIVSRVYGFDPGNFEFRDTPCYRVTGKAYESGSGTGANPCGCPQENSSWWFSFTGTTPQQLNSNVPGIPMPWWYFNIEQV